MPHNFRRHIELGLPESACAFVSKAGSDQNDGLSPNTPKKTIYAGGQVGRAYIMVGADTYANEQLGSYAGERNFYADGCVVLKGDVGLTLATPNGWVTTFNDFIIFRYSTLAIGTTTSQRPTSYYSCYIIGGSASAAGYDISRFYDCTLKGVSIYDGTQLSVGVDFQYCNIIGSNVSTRYAFQYCYLDAASTLSISETAANPNSPLSAQINNVRCGVSISGVGYNSLADARAASPGLFTQSINAEPAFNKPEKDDYTLKISSPHLNLSIGPRHLRLSSAWVIETDASPGEDITANNIRLRSVANPAYFVAPVPGTVSNLIANAQGGIEVKPNSLGNNEGAITWNPRRIAESPSEINYYNFTTGLNFNSDFSSDSSNPSPYNSNVPDYSNYTTGAAGRNPNRIAEQWRWSRGVSPDPSTPADWVTGNVFLDFELFRAPWWNTNPIRGNADPSFAWTDAKELPTATFVQSRWRLRQDRTV